MIFKSRYAATLYRVFRHAATPRVAGVASYSVTACSREAGTRKREAESRVESNRVESESTSRHAVCNLHYWITLSRVATRIRYASRLYRARSSEWREPRSCENELLKVDLSRSSVDTSDHVANFRAETKFEAQGAEFDESFAYLPPRPKYSFPLHVSRESFEIVLVVPATRCILGSRRTNCSGGSVGDIQFGFG